MGGGSMARPLVTLLLVAAPLAVAAPSEAAFPPGNNGLIVFVSFQGGDGDVITIGADGSNPVNLTPDSDVNDLRPAFSPDGTRIAFDRLDGGDEDIFVMGADGSNPINLTPGSPGSDTDPAFSPDGTRIAFVNGGDIFVMPAAGGSPTNLTPGAPGGEAPTFSPDGTRIAFNRFAGDWDVFAMNAADGGNVTNLTETSTSFDADPAYSPDGSRIAFESTRDGGQDLFTAGADGSNPVNLLPGGPYEQQAVFSPDGTRIVFSSGVGMGVPDLFTMGTDGSSPMNWTQTATVGEGYPDWQRLEPEPPDSDPPETEITKGPKKKTRKRKAKFEFSTDEPGSTFECKLDKSEFEPCDPTEQFKVKRRKHILDVRAVDPAGNADPTPAERKWKVKKKKKKK
jgi:dipeptidyl aminopeptidase/acylaminoacyl peptidase